MYAIMGVNGRVGGTVARALLERGHRVRAIVRSESRAGLWHERGAEPEVADSADETALTKALRDVVGVFVMIPPFFAPQRGFPETTEIVRVIRRAIEVTRPRRIVCLSSVGAQHEEATGLIQQSHILEQKLADLDTPQAFLRAAWFMENASWDLPPARERGLIDSYLQPTARRIPMVATEDIGTMAASLLTESWTGRRVVELEGPARVSPDDIAAAFSVALRREVRAEPIPRSAWPARFRAQGTQWSAPRCEMLDGFNSGWIDFEGVPVRGRTTLEEVVRSMVAGGKRDDRELT
jgi:NAD(P)H dehydrogenase (quinone)